MAKYSNRIKRKRFIKKATHKFVRLINFTTNETEQSVPLYKYIWNDIKNGLDYGMDEIRYNLYYANDHMPSLEGIYTEYFNQSGTDRELQVMYKALKELLPIYIQRYNDLDFTYGEDNKGLYIAINYGSNN